MSFLKKLELSTGITTALLGVGAALWMLKTDREALLRIERDFPVLREALFALFFFVIPGSIVGIGSYVHSKKGKIWGQVLLSAGVMLVIAVFMFLFFLLAFPGIANLWFGLNLLLPVLAIATLIASLIPRRR